MAPKREHKRHTRISPQSIAAAKLTCAPIAVNRGRAKNTRASHHLSTKNRRTMRAGRRRARRPDGSEFCREAAKKGREGLGLSATGGRATGRERSSRLRRLQAQAAQPQIARVPIGAQSARQGRGSGREASNGGPHRDNRSFFVSRPSFCLCVHPTGLY